MKRRGLLLKNASAFWAALFVMITCRSHFCLAADSSLKIYPPPKEIVRTGEEMALFNLSGEPICAIVTGDKPDQKTSLGIGEINNRLQDTCGKELPVIQSGSSAVSKYDNLIYVGMPSKDSFGHLMKLFSIDLSAMRYANQGYKINFGKNGGKQIAVICSRGELGVLYACLTFCSLIKQDPQVPKVICAQIDDWPDFKYRCVSKLGFMYGYRKAFGFFGSPNLAGGTMLTRELIDELLHLKINMVNIDIDRPVPGSVIDEYCAGASDQIKWIEEMSKYARDRGVDPFLITSTCIDSQLKGSGSAPKAEGNVCVSIDSSWRITEYCWSRDDLLVKRAEKVADYVKQMKISSVFLHTVDAYNQKWEKRCKQCRERFGEDQAAAQAHVFSIFNQAIKRKCPDVKIIMVPRPYQGYDIDLPNNKWLKDRLEKISSRIPEDLYMAVTAGTKNSIYSWKKNLRRPLVYWLNTGSHLDNDGWFLGDPMLGFIKNYYYANSNGMTGDTDIMMISGATNQLQRSWAACAAWNVNYPLGCKSIESNRIYKIPNRENCSTEDEVYNGKGTIDQWVWGYNGKDFDWFDVYKEFLNDVVFRETLKELCCEVYGKSAGGMLVDAYLSGYSGKYLLNPLGETFRSFSNSNYNAYSKSTSKAMGEYYSRISQADAGLSGLSKLRNADLPVKQSVLSEIYKVASIIKEAKAKSFLWWGLLSLKETLNDPVELQAISEFCDRQSKEQLKSVCDFYDELPLNAANLIGAKRQKADFIKWCDGMRENYDIILGIVSKDTRANKIRQKYEGGKIRVAVYNPTSRGGKVYGYKALCGTLTCMPEVEVSYVDRISREILAPFHCLFIPDLKKLGDEEKKDEFCKSIREFCIGGGNVYLQHDSVGFHRFALGMPLFPEFVAATDIENGEQLVVACDHPLVKNQLVGSAVTHMYYDRILLRPGELGETVLTNAKGAPALLAGHIGSGKVVLDGTITYNRSGNPGEGEVSDANEINKALISNAIAWFCQKQKEKMVLEVSDIHVDRVVQPDAIHFMLILRPRLLFDKQLSKEKVSFKIAFANEEAHNNTTVKKWDEVISGNTWQPLEKFVNIDLAVDPKGKLLLIEVRDGNGDTLERKYRVF
ncbi:MAG: hypothetical protein PHT33_05285 [bacterium]|nr:hypothetical protein [bacterium]